MNGTAEVLNRPNRYAARCIRCGGWIKPGEGLLAKAADGRWAADHPADCPTTKPTTIATPQPTSRANSDGIYRTPDGTIYKVQIAHHGSGNLYAKRLVIHTTDDGPKGTFEYEQGAIHRLQAEWKLSLDEAREYGRLYAICCACGATLTDEVSIEAGIGPICGKRYFDA